MAKTDPKDDKIAELQLALEAANMATADAQSDAQQVTAVRAQVTKLEEKIAKLEKQVKDLEAENAELRSKSGGATVAKISGLGANAVELRISSLITNAITKQPVTAIAGDVLAEAERFEEIAKKVGTTVRVHPVSKDELEAARKSGRAY